MGQFRASARLTGPTGRGEETELSVDTGSTRVALPRALADRLELEVARHRAVTTPCFIVPDGPALLGAVAPESRFLAVDPVAKRLVPTEGLVV